ncbi:MAG TPA: hypothetical protein VMF89_12000, partial [Polyangiales bacterium]|nr:hypothetical protein [Polyangiales bacterium]
MSESHQRSAGSWQIRALCACSMLLVAACAAATDETLSPADPEPALRLATQPLINGMKYKPRS